MHPVAYLFLVCFSCVGGVQFSWNPLIASGLWNNASCWIPSGVPSPEDAVIINGMGLGVYVEISSPTSVGDFTLMNATLLVAGTTFKFTGQSSVIEKDATMIIGPASTVAFSRLDVYGLLNVTSDTRDMSVTVLSGLSAPADGQPTSQLNVYSRVSLQGVTGSQTYLNVSNLLVMNYGTLYLTGPDTGVSLYVWLRENTTIVNQAGALVDMRQSNTTDMPWFMYFIRNWDEGTQARLVNYGLIRLAGITVDGVAWELHGDVELGLQTTLIGGKVPFVGSQSNWNIGACASGVNFGGLYINLQKWKICGGGQGVAQFNVWGLGVQSYARFESGSLEIDAHVEFTAVKMSPGYDVTVTPAGSLTINQWDIARYGDDPATLLDGAKLVNHGKLSLYANVGIFGGDMLHLNNGGTIVNSATGVFTITARGNVTARCTEGIPGGIINQGWMNVSVPVSNPPFLLPIYSSGVMRIITGNFTAGAGLYVSQTKLGSDEIILGGRLAVFNSTASFDVVSINSTYASWPGVFAQLEGATVNISMFVFLKNAKYEWYDGDIIGPGNLDVMASSSLITQFSPHVKHTPTLYSRLTVDGSVKIRHPTNVGNGALVSNVYGTVDIQKGGSMFFQPDSAFNNLLSANWHFQARVNSSGTLLTCSTCW